MLAAHSSVLKRMFKWEERKASSLQLQYNADIVKKFVKFFYKMEIEEGEGEEALRCLLELAEKYHLVHLKEEVEELLIRKLTVENMVEMFLLADLHTAPSFKIAAEEFIRTNRLKVKEDLAELDKLEPDQRMKIVSICIV